MWNKTERMFYKPLSGKEMNGFVLKKTFSEWTSPLEQVRSGWAGVWR